MAETTTPPLPLTRESIQHALDVIAASIHRTPLLMSSTLSAETGSGRNQLLFKAENLQKGGAFKMRGAAYSISCLSEEEKRAGVCAHSSGNHAGALALAARTAGIPAYIVIPSDAPAPKIAATRSYGAQVTLCEPTMEARASTLKQIQDETGAVFIPPFDALNTMLGAGTTFIEVEQQAEEMGLGKVAAIVAPVGGGGLLGGISIAAKGTGVRVFGAEPEAAGDCAQGLASGERITKFSNNTIADGLKTPVGVRNFTVIQENVENVITVTEEEIRTAQRLLMERLKVVVEPSGAVPFAVVRSEAFQALGIEGPIAVVMSGGNVDLDKLFA
ncbi:hypothetical protein JCM8097_009334 [Rhodosporidiobolus ruineniae]